VGGWQGCLDIPPSPPTGKCFLAENINFLTKMAIFEKKIACSANLKKNYQKK
jgi:hypothetical protein